MASGAPDATHEIRNGARHRDSRQRTGEITHVIEGRRPKVARLSRER